MVQGKRAPSCITCRRQSTTTTFPSWVRTCARVCWYTVIWIEWLGPRFYLTSCLLLLPHSAFFLPIFPGLRFFGINKVLRRKVFFRNIDVFNGLPNYTVIRYIFFFFFLFSSFDLLCISSILLSHLHLVCCNHPHMNVVLDCEPHPTTACGDTRPVAAVTRDLAGNPLAS